MPRPTVRAAGARLAGLVLLVLLAAGPAVLPATTARADAPDLRATQMTTPDGLGLGAGNRVVVTVAYDSDGQFLPVPAFRVTLRVTGDDHDATYQQTVSLTGGMLDQTPGGGVFTAEFPDVAFPAPGTYQVRALVDDTNLVPETDELHEGGQPAGGGAGLYGTVDPGSNNVISRNCTPTGNDTGGCTTLPVLLEPLPVRPVVDCPGPYRVTAPDGRCVWSCGQGTEPDPATNTCVCQPRRSPIGTDRLGRRICR